MNDTTKKPTQPGADYADKHLKNHTVEMVIHSRATHTVQQLDKLKRGPDGVGGIFRDALLCAFAELGFDPGENGHISVELVWRPTSVEDSIRAVLKETDQMLKEAGVVGVALGPDGITVITAEEEEDDSNG